MKIKATPGKTLVLVDQQDPQVELIKIEIDHQQEGDILNIVVFPGEDFAKLDYLVENDWKRAEKIIISFGGS